MTARARITTFYSYKGGVGRSMALANTAVLMARAGRRVLAIDFDLDAPGLHRYFPAPVEETPKSGTIDFFYALRTALEDVFFADSSFDPTDPVVLGTCREIIRGLLSSEAYVRKTGEDNLTLMTAGRFDQAYAERVRTFDWNGFYAEFGEVFTLLRDELKLKYDDVVVDARTGLTDIGSISTVILPDRLVVVFTPNEQSIAGGAQIARQAFRMHEGLTVQPRALEPLDIVPLLSRVDRDEVELRDHWVHKAADVYARLFRELFGRSIDFLQQFDNLHIPYRPYYSYGERIAVVDDKDRGLGGLVEAFNRLHDVLSEPAQRALLLDFDARVTPPTELGLSPNQIFRAPNEGDERSSSPWTMLRQKPEDGAVWENCRRVLDAAILRATRDAQGMLHVMGMMPYGVAVLLGRRLDDLARSVPLSVYHFQDNHWQLFSSPAGGEGDRVFDASERVLDGLAGENIILSIEGMRPIGDELLTNLGRQIGVGRIARLRQRSPEPLRAPRQTMQAVGDVRRELARLQSAHPSANFHIVTTAPIALLVEVGRLLSPTVYRGATIYQYQPDSASYVPTLDVVGLARHARS